MQAIASIALLIIVLIAVGWQANDMFREGEKIVRGR